MTPDPREHPEPTCSECGEPIAAWHFHNVRVTSLDPDPRYVEPDPEPSSRPGAAVWIVAAGLVGIALVVGLYLASRA